MADLVCRGVVAGLVTSPRSVWSAGTRAGQTVGRRTMGEPHASDSSEPDSELYREAAAELVDIHTHDPADAHREYVRSAAYAEHDQVLRVVGDITGTACLPEVSDDAATIDT